MKDKKKVFVGLSGGVDSSVSAGLLKKAGYDVTGVFIKVWHPDWLPCGWKEERRDAMRVAAALDIPFMTFDFSEEYKRSVVDNMISEYKEGRTPNPDVLCNTEIKFGSFLNKSLEMGADYIATGHYARTTPNPLLGKGGGDTSLLEGADKNKDQSYFLWMLSEHELSHAIFPVGNLQKSQVRKLADKFHLPTSEKKDSQGLCFMGKVDMKEFLSHYIDSKPGDVLKENGEVIGKHDGAFLYTIGERHGFEIFKKTSNDAPLYVVKKDIKNNTLTVSPRNAEENSSRAGQSVILKNVRLRTKIQESKNYGARIRYRQEKQECKITTPSRKAETPLLGKGGEVEISFSLPQDGIAQGQSVVFYDGETCIGGGMVDKIL